MIYLSSHEIDNYKDQDIIMGEHAITCILIIIVLIGRVQAQSPFEGETKAAIKDLKELVGIPNNGLHKTDILANIDWLVNAFESRGFTTSILETEGNPLLYATFEVDTDLPTILFYMHVDGQPVDPSRWDQKDPYDVSLKTKNLNGKWSTLDWSIIDEKIDPRWRLFGRSAADDKAPIIAFLHTMDILQKSKEPIKANIKVIVDGEEEIGSTSLPAAVDRYRDKLQADVLIINDGPVHISGDPTLVFGCRGVIRVDLTVFGPVTPQHSGHFGNYAPNPVFRMSHLLSSMKDEEGRVTIAGYYQGIIIDDETRSVLEAVPDDEQQILGLLQLAAPEKVGANYQEALQYPSLNVRGVSAGWVGSQARTIVPDVATAAIDIRLVPESDPDMLVNAIRKHIETQGFHIVDQEPTREERMKHDKLIFMYSGKATLPFRTNLSSSYGQWLAGALKKSFNKDPIRIRIMGGTVPIASFINKLDLPAIIVPMVNADNNQHSPNENMRIGHLTNAMQTFHAILTHSMEGF